MCRDRNFVFRQAAYICIQMRTDLTQQCYKIMEIRLIPYIYYVVYFHMKILTNAIYIKVYLFRIHKSVEISIQNNVRKRLTVF